MTCEDIAMRTGTARTTAVMVAISALVVIAVGLALCWHEIRIQYHLYCLRNEPGYLKEVVSAPENSPQRIAMVEFLDTDRGKERFFELYLEIHGHSITALAGVERHRCGGNGVLFDPAGKFVAAFHKEGIDFVMVRGSESGTDKQTSVSMESLLPCLVGVSYTSDRYADLVFSFSEPQAAHRDPLTSELLEELRRSKPRFLKRAIVISVTRNADRNSDSLGVDG